MNRKRTAAVLLVLVLLLIFCGCSKSAEPIAQQTTEETALPEETEEKFYYTHPRNPQNEDGTFTIRLRNASVNVALPEGTEDRGHSAEKVILGRENDGYFVQYSVIEVPGNLETTVESMYEKMNDTCSRAFDNGILYQRMTDEVTVNNLDFSWDILTLQPEDRPFRTTFRAWAPLLEEDGVSYYVELAAVPNMPNGEDFQFTREDFGPWLEAVSPVTE